MYGESINGMAKGRNLFQSAREVGLPEVVQALEDLTTSQDQLKQSDKQILERLDLIDKHNEDRDERIKNLFNGFPAGDVEGHRRYHEMQIEILAERRKLRAAIQEKTISALVWILIVAVGTAIWHEISSTVIALRGSAPSPPNS